MSKELLQKRVNDTIQHILDNPNQYWLREAGKMLFDPDMDSLEVWSVFAATIKKRYGNFLNFAEEISNQCLYQDFRDSYNGDL